MPNDFYHGSDWQQSSEPILTRMVHKTCGDPFDSGVYIIWPVDAFFSKDTLEDGLHPVVAVGNPANRPRNLTGVVVNYNADCEIAVIDFADKKIVRQYVDNILTYTVQDSGDPATFKNVICAGDPVYVDDSAALPAGVTLSFSMLNDAGLDNPLAGYVWWCQDEMADWCVGGPNTEQEIPQPAEEATQETLTLCVMLVNDFGAEHLRIL